MQGSLASGTATVADLIAAVQSIAPSIDDAERIGRIRQFEALKATVAAAQAQEVADFAAAQKAAQAAAGTPVDRQGRGVAAQVALARRCSPWQAKRYVGWASVLTAELPQTFATLQAGRTTEWRAMLVARETIWLSREDRAVVDAELAPHLEELGDAQVEAAARKAAYRLDPRGSLERASSAATDRRVSIRPAPDTMCRLTALLPVVQGVAAYAALSRAADTTTAAGDDRGRGQIMADALVERVTGLATAAAVPVEVDLVMTDRTLLAPAWSEADEQDDEPGVIVGYGPVPAAIARAIARGSVEQGQRGPRWLRRLFLHPATGQLAAMESKRRLFTDNQQQFLRIRDERCRTPWCGAPIRHGDHVRPHVDGGPTSVENGGGTCQACNIAKQAPGWRSGVTADGTVVTRTPTGHVYRSRLPDPPGQVKRRSAVDLWFRQQLSAA